MTAVSFGQGAVLLQDGQHFNYHNQTLSDVEIR